MDVSPKALREVEFREVSRRGGYHPEDVDEFIEEVAKGVEALQDRLRQAVERAQRAEAAASEATGSDETLRRTLVLAQRTADLAVQEAREQASRILAGAEQQAQALLADTEERARRTHEEALGAIRTELSALEGTRQRSQSEVDGLQRWIDEHRHHLMANLRDAMAAVERAGAVSPVPSSTPVDTGRPQSRTAIHSPGEPGESTGSGATPQTPPPVPSPTQGSEERSGPGRSAATPPPVSGPPTTGTASVAAPQAASAAAAAVADDAASVGEDPGPATAARVADRKERHAAATGEVTVVDVAGPEREPDGIDGDLNEADARALDDFFEDGEYSDDRRFGGRLRRRR
jgi:DivIVA domain-containing protein